MAGRFVPPPLWRRVRRAQLLVAVVAVAGAAAVPTLLADARARWRVIAVVLLLAIAVQAALVAASGLRGGGRVRLRTGTGRSVTEFPGSRVGVGAVSVLLLMLAAGVALAVVALARRDSPLGWSGVTVLVALVVWTLQRVVSRATASRGRGEVLLGRHGVEVHGLLRGSLVRWEQNPTPVAWDNGVLRVLPAEQARTLRQWSAERPGHAYRPGEG